MHIRNLLAAIVLLAACGSAALAAEGEKIRVACVGDSITFGSQVQNREQNNYPRKLGELLGPQYEVRNFGVSGATLLKNGDKPYWKLRELKLVEEFKPNIVIIKLGTNDSKPQNWKHGDEFAADLTALVEHFAGLPTAPQVFLCKPAPVIRGAFGINGAVVQDQVIPRLDEVAAAKKLTTIDVFTALEDHPEYFPDGVHPNAAGAEVIARTVFAALRDKAPPSE